MDEAMINELKEMLSELSSRLDELPDEIGDLVETTVEGVVQDALEDAFIESMPAQRGSNTLLTILTQDGKAILPIHAVKARRIKKGAEEYGIWVNWCDNCECVGKYPNKEAALAEVERMMQCINARSSQVYKMN